MNSTLFSSRKKTLWNILLRLLLQSDEASPAEPPTIPTSTAAGPLLILLVRLLLLLLWTVTEDPVAASAEAPPHAPQNTVDELLVGVSATVYNLYTFVAEEAQRIIDHVNNEFKKLYGCLDLWTPLCKSFRPLYIHQL